MRKQTLLQTYVAFHTLKMDFQDYGTGSTDCQFIDSISNTDCNLYWERVV